MCIRDRSPTAHLQENPYSYGTVYYPQETSNMGDGHYVIFDVLSHNKSAYKTSTFDNGRLNKVGDDPFGRATSNRNIKNIKSRGIAQTNRVRGVNSGLFEFGDYMQNKNESLIFNNTLDFKA